MAQVIDMQSMRQLNLFTKVCRVQTKHFYMYSNTMVFGVPKQKVSQAIGKDAANIKKLNTILRKKIKVIAMPKNDDIEGIKQFVLDLVDPIEVNKITIDEHKIEINATRVNRAALIGRNRSREKELLYILKSAFNITDVKIA